MWPVLGFNLCWLDRAEIKKKSGVPVTDWKFELKSKKVAVSDKARSSRTTTETQSTGEIEHQLYQ